MLVTGLAAQSADAATARSQGRHIVYRHWDTGRQWRTGKASGTSGGTGALRLTRPTRTMSVAGKRYRAGSWVSPWVRPGFAATEVVPSWAASTPRNTLIQVEVRGTGLRGRRTSWDDLAAGPAPTRLSAAPASAASATTAHTSRPTPGWPTATASPPGSCG